MYEVTIHLITTKQFYIVALQGRPLVSREGPNRIQNYILRYLCYKCYYAIDTILLDINIHINMQGVVDES